jgi:hypothetical protein
LIPAGIKQQFLTPTDHRLVARPNVVSLQEIVSTRPNVVSLREIVSTRPNVVSLQDIVSARLNVVSVEGSLENKETRLSLLN